MIMSNQFYIIAILFSFKHRSYLTFMKKTAFLLIGLLIIVSNVLAQHIQKSSSQILQDIKKLNVLGNVLYWAAHPDDENTRLIAYFSNEVLVNTAYLAATRGDGGQNLVGPEIREGLGVIRTQELLAARRVDGGQQFFTRANDFGYSKTANETLKIWDKDQVLSDMVWVIRKFRPDVIITRFPPDKRAGHGHHASSAILAEEAFKLANNKNAYPEQLKYVSTWQPTRLMINSGRWWDKEIEKQPNTIKIDVGTYNAALGLSYTEMAATSRSQHKSQGFGATHFRGSQFEYLKPVLGEPVQSDLFEGIDLTWNRAGVSKLSNEVNEIIQNYNPAHPSKSVSALLKLRQSISKVKDAFWKSKKLKEVDDLIVQCAGLFMEATAISPLIVPGDSLYIKLELVNRSALEISIQAVKLNNENQLTNNILLADNQKQVEEIDMLTPKSLAYGGPYWLNSQATLGMYHVANQLLRGLPENDPAFNVKLNLNIEGTPLEYTIPVSYKWTDRVEGERYRPLTVVPPLTSSFDDKVLIFDNGNSKVIGVNVHANHNVSNAIIRLNLPKGWKSEPAQHSLKSLKKGNGLRIEFKVLPNNSTSVVQVIGIEAEITGELFHRSMQTIQYEHIPYQVLLPKATAKAVSLDISVGAKSVGYIMGAGDEVPKALDQMGVKVWVMTEADITAENLQLLDAVILGVRAINTQAYLKNKKDVLLNYVHQGGTIITQYNTTRRIDWNTFAPYPLSFLGGSARNRVAEESAEVIITNPEAVVLNYPNAISSHDFEGWVQERGLYFPSEWDDHYEAPLAMQDTGEKVHNGSLLVAHYGKGHYVYTGLSFFRELPAGVPGAYRLFANIISLSSSPDSILKPK